MQNHKKIFLTGQHWIPVIHHISPQDRSAAITKAFTYAPERGDGLASIDDTIAYTIIASNDGNVDLSEVTVTDARFLNSNGKP